MLKFRRQAGDTIVEVMVVLTVLGLAISICYATANRSLLDARQAQENTIATNMAKSQVEALRWMSANPDSSAPGGTIYDHVLNQFCIKATTTGTTTTYAKITDGFPGPTDNYAAACTQSFYTISALYCSSSTAAACVAKGLMSADDNFLVNVSWADVRGDGQDNVSLIYRVHLPGAPASITAPTGGGTVQDGEVLTVPPKPRETAGTPGATSDYSLVCQTVDNLGDPISYYSLTGHPCAGGGTYQYQSSGDTSGPQGYNHACLFDDGRYGYINVSITDTARLPKGCVLQDGN